MIDRVPAVLRSGMRPMGLGTMLAVLVSLTAWGTAALGSSSPEPTPPRDAGAPVYVDSVDILYLESHPVQASLHVSGSLPTPCHEAVWEVQDLGDSIDVRLWSEADTESMCITVLEPVEISIPLGSFESADLPVLLDGEVVGQLHIEMEPDTGDTALVGAGWSFGECASYCSADLAIDGDKLVLGGRDRMAEEPLFVNVGTLTAEAQGRIAEALAALQGVTLEPVYGCPDCAAGGAAYVTLGRDGTTSSHELEFGNPPVELAELYELSMAMISALETCQSSDLVAVADGCQPRSR